MGNDAINFSIIYNMKNILVILDNGHGRTTKGKRSPSTEDGRVLQEWKWNREIVNRIAARLEDEGIDYYVLVPTDEDMGLTKRATTANQVDPIMITGHECAGRILISVHGNALGDGTRWCSGKGWEMYTTKGRTNSDKLALCFEEAFCEIYKGENERRYRGLKEEDFTILVKTNCPCVLTENFFYDNRDDFEYMMSEKGKSEIVELHIRAIKKYIERL